MNIFQTMLEGLVALIRSNTGRGEGGEREREKEGANQLQSHDLTKLVPDSKFAKNKEDRKEGQK